MYMTKNGYQAINESELDIRGREHNGNVRSTCPACRDSKQHGKDACMSYNTETGWGYCFKCHTVFVKQNQFETFTNKRYGTQQSAKTYKQPDIKRLRDDYSSSIMAYLKQRCISPATAHKLGVKCYSESIPNTSIERHWLSFQFLEGDKCVNIQHKSTDKHFRFEADCDLIPYNINSLAGSKIAYITEEMMDTLAMVECGYEACISVPNGTGTDLKKFDRFKDLFDGMETIYYAGDTDEAGLKFGDEVVAYFGEARCKRMTWVYRDPQNPERDFVAKDCNEMLMARGKEAVNYCIAHAWNSPIEGVVTLSDVESQLDDFYEHGIPDGVTINLLGYRHLVKFKLGSLYVYTAYPGQGKSTFVDFTMLQLLCQYKWKAAIFSPEKYPTSQHYHELITTVTGKPCNSDKLSRPAYLRAKKYIQENVFEISGEGDNKIETILHTAEQLVIRHHIRQLVLDPFNYIQLPMIAGANDTQKISEVLKAIIAFAHRFQVLIHLVCHPRKPSNDYGKQQRPTLSDINGSQDFANKADVGIVIQREKMECEIGGRLEMCEVSIVSNEKTRFGQMGQLGRIAVTFDKESHRFFGCNEKTVPGIDGKNGELKTHIIYIPQPHDNVDWLSDSGEQQTIQFAEDDENGGMNGDMNGGMNGNTSKYGSGADAMPF